MGYTDGLGADVIYESVGGTATTMQDAQSMVRPGGTIAVIGSFRDSSGVDLRQLLRKEVNLLFAWSYAMWDGVAEFQISIDMLADGRVDCDSLVSHRFPLDEIQDAFSTALDRYASDAIKVLINPDPDPRFLQEARAAAALHHHGIVAIDDMGKDHEGRDYIVMELVEGEEHALELLPAVHPVAARVREELARLPG